MRIKSTLYIATLLAGQNLPVEYLAGHVRIYCNKPTILLQNLPEGFAEEWKLNEEEKAFVNVENPEEKIEIFPLSEYKMPVEWD